MISFSILERSKEDIILESVSLRLDVGWLDIYTDERAWREPDVERGGTYDDVVDERERGVAISELAVL